MSNKNNKSTLNSLILMVMMFVSYPLLAVEPLVVEPGSSYSVAKGGRLYDKWFKENAVPSPKQAHPAYPDSAKYKGKKGADWRCKECHGWDYKGKDGLYQSGKHYSGIPGIMQAKDKTREELMTILSNETHHYSKEMLSEQNKKDLVNFIKSGTLDMTKYIDVTSNKAKGNADKGKQYFETLCAACHGLNSAAEDMPNLAELANKNPWEVMHKILYGQPAEDMPALIAFDPSVATDIITHLQQLKAE